MQAGKTRLVWTDPTVDFTGAIVQNASAQANIGFGVLSPCRIRGWVILSVENLAWELWLFGKSTFRTGAVATEAFRGRWSFAAGDGLQVGATGLYAYYIDGLDSPYLDEDAAQKLHLLLVNRSAAAKTSGANGALKIGVVLEETFGGG